MTLPLLARGGYRPQLATQTLLRSLRAALCLLALVTLPAHAQDPGTLNPQPLPPLPNPDAPNTPANELFGRKTTPLSRPIPLDRLIWRRLSCGCCCAPDQRPDLASDAKIAQSLLGKSELGGLY